MASDRDYYAILGVERSATVEELKKAYRRLAMECHPDRCPGDPDAAERFKELTQAYQVLSDGGRRAHYDHFGMDARSSGRGGPEVSFSGVDLQAFLSFFEGLFGDLFSTGSGFHRGRDVRVDADVAFEVAARGGAVQVRAPRPVLCQECGGTGARKGTEPVPCRDCDGKGTILHQRGFFGVPGPCSSCGGRGRVIHDPCPACRGRRIVVREETLTVDIPAGVEDGATKILSGRGEPGLDGAPPGDLHLVVHLRAHPIFRREGRDVHADLRLTFPQAALGDVLEVPTLDGPVKIKVEPGTQPDRAYRLKGKGIGPKGSRRGDHLVHIVLEVPKKLSENQRSLVERLGRELGQEIHPAKRNLREKIKDLMEP